MNVSIQSLSHRNVSRQTVSFGQKFLYHGPEIYADSKKPRQKRIRAKAMIASMLAMVSGFMGIQTYRSHQLEKALVQKAQSRMDTRQDYFSWPENTKIYAATTQDEQGTIDLGWCNPLTKSRGFIYSEKMLAHLQNPQVHSLEEAHHSLEQGIPNYFRYYCAMAQVPVSSITPVRGWLKGEHKNRLMILINGHPQGFTPPLDKIYNDKDEEKLFLEQIRHIQQVFQEQYHLENDHIKALNQPTFRELHQTFQWLQEQQKKDPNTEVLLYLVGHGSGGRQPGVAEQPQGYFTGGFEMNGKELLLLEDEMKNLFHSYLEGFPSVTLVMDCCHAGTWIA